MRNSITIIVLVFLITSGFMTSQGREPTVQKGTIDINAAIVGGCNCDDKTLAFWTKDKRIIWCRWLDLSKPFLETSLKPRESVISMWGSKTVTIVLVALNRDEKFYPIPAELSFQTFDNATGNKLDTRLYRGRGIPRGLLITESPISRDDFRDEWKVAISNRFTYCHLWKGAVEDYCSNSSFVTSTQRFGGTVVVSHYSKQGLTNEAIKLEAKEEGVSAIYSDENTWRLLSHDGVNVVTRNGNAEAKETISFDKVERYEIFSGGSVIESADGVYLLNSKGNRRERILERAKSLEWLYFGSTESVVAVRRGESKLYLFQWPKNVD